MNKINIYRLQCLTNMHVGDGEANFNIIDNEVQRDIVLGVPTIHSSGVKGALRSFFRENSQDKSTEDAIFGTGGETGRQGGYKFFSANLIARPLRISEGSGAYVMATSVDVINTELKLLKSLGFPVKRFLDEALGDRMVGAQALKGKVKAVEGEAITCWEESPEPVLGPLIGGNWLLVPHDRLRGYGLPVQARNVLDNGKSCNLWYEEVVPHESIFYVAVEYNEPEDRVYQLIQKTGGVVQFGANASIGYGFCQVTKLDRWEESL